MSNITDILSSAQGGQLIDNLAQRFGLSTEQMNAAVKALIPALSMGLQNAAGNPDSLQHVISAVTQPAHHAAYENPDSAHSQASVDQGRDIVANLFGSNAAAGQVAQLAARESSVRPDILSQLLPILAPIILGGLFKSLNSQGLGGILGSLASSGASGSAPKNPTGGAAAEAAPGGGLLGSLLRALLGALSGGGERNAPATTEAAPSSPGRLDPATLQMALEKIKQTLQPGAAAVGAGHNQELEDVLGKVFGPNR